MLIANTTKRPIMINFAKKSPGGGLIPHRVTFVPGINEVSDKDWTVLKEDKYFNDHRNAGTLTDSETEIKRGKEIKAQAASELAAAKGEASKNAEALKEAEEANEKLAEEKEALEKELAELKAAAEAKPAEKGGKAK